ncbi:hypothetical protein [Nocardia nova]|nr:hypothetical protein [Nocardia nova]
MPEQQPISLNTEQFQIEVNRALTAMMHEAAPDLPEIFWCFTDFAKCQIGGQANTVDVLDQWAERLQLALSEHTYPGLRVAIGELQIDGSAFKVQLNCMFDPAAFDSHNREEAAKFWAARREVQTSPTPSDLPS